MDQKQRSSALIGSATLVALVVVVAVLYLAREVFIPFALAVLFSFLLGPLVTRFRYWGFPRIPAVLTVVALFFSVLALIGWLVSAQVVDLAYKFPEYEQNVREKMKSFRIPEGGILDRVTKTLEEISQDISAPGAAAGRTSEWALPEAKPVPVEIRQPTYSWRVVRDVLGSLAGPMVTAGIVLVFIVFMLAQREDLRDRLFRLIGAGRLNITTPALDDAAQRVSRYLLMQLAINTLYGIAVGVGLHFLDVPNPMLWGVLASILRFVPYLGIWIAALLPAAVAFAIGPDPLKPLLILALYLGVDLVAYNILEPLLYGASTGITPLAILLAAVFWTWLWGPIGLVLSTPLTVCLVVLGRHLPSLEFISILLSNEPVLSPEVRFYQRLLALNLKEATKEAQEFLKTQPLQELYDSVVIPALLMAGQDRRGGTLEPTRHRLIVANTRLLIENLSQRIEKKERRRAARKRRRDDTQHPELPSLATAERLPVLCLPAGDEVDELAAVMLGQVLRQRGFCVTTLSAGSPADKAADELKRQRYSVACISAMPPSGLVKARNACKQLHHQSAGLKVLVGLWNDPEEEARLQGLLAPDEDYRLVTTLKDALNEIFSLATQSQQTQPP